MQLHHLNEWGKNKPPLIRIMAKQLAFSPAEVQWGLDKNRQRRFDELWPLPRDPAQWLRHYTRTQRITRQVFDVIFSGDRVLRFRLTLFWVIMGRVQRTPRSVLEAARASLTDAQWQFACLRWQYLLKDTERRLDRHLLRQVNDDSPVPEEIQQRIALPDFQFFLRVLVPCILMHGVRPSHLLRQARQGDPKAAAKLVQLDPTVEQDPLIRKHKHASAHSDAPTFHRQVCKAALKPPYRPMTVNAHKARLGAYLQHMAKEYGYRLSSGDVRRYFDAAARDSHNLLRDPDLPLEDDAHRIALHREQNRWKKSFVRDKR